jgi:hypothetical protein
VFSGGFGEGGDPKGRALGEELKRVIEEAGLAVSGPNCMGNLAAPYRLMTIPDDHQRARARTGRDRRPERRFRLPDRLDEAADRPNVGIVREIADVIGAGEPKLVTA